MLHWFIRFPDFIKTTAFNESSAPFRKNFNKVTLSHQNKFMDNLIKLDKQKLIVFL